MLVVFRYWCHPGVRLSEPGTLAQYILLSDCCMARGCGHTHHERTHRHNNSNNMPWAFCFKVSTAQIEKCTSFRETWLRESTSRQHHQYLLHQRSWENTSRQHQQCLAERKWRSTSRHPQQCLVKRTGGAKLRALLQQCHLLHQRPLWSASRHQQTSVHLLTSWTTPRPVPAVYVAMLLEILLACSCRSTSRETPLSLARHV